MVAWDRVTRRDVLPAIHEYDRPRLPWENYTLGPDVDLSKYRAVSVWCKRFSVNFGAARLMRESLTMCCPGHEQATGDVRYDRPDLSVSRRSRYSAISKLESAAVILEQSNLSEPSLAKMPT